MKENKIDEKSGTFLQNSEKLVFHPVIPDVRDSPRIEFDVRNANARSLSNVLPILNSGGRGGEGQTPFKSSLWLYDIDYSAVNKYMYSNNTFLTPFNTPVKVNVISARARDLISLINNPKCHRNRVTTDLKFISNYLARYHTMNNKCYRDRSF